MLKVRTRSEWILLVGGSAKIVGRVQLIADAETAA